MNEEYIVKLKKVHTFIRENLCDGILLSRWDSFSWITCGARDSVLKFTDTGVVDILITGDEQFVIASEIERYRINEEEVGNLGFDILSYDWYENRETILKKIIRNRKIVSDTGVLGTKNVHNDFCKLRYSLMPEEIIRLKEVCLIAANAVNEVCHEIVIGDTELDIAANLNCKLMKSGVEAPVCLIAADQRIKKYRHPVPTNNKVSKYALVVIGAEKYGLFASASRMVSFGKPDGEILKKHKACMNIDAVFIKNTRVGSKTSDILRKAVNSYSDNGYPNEWKCHHQGGATGYAAREYITTFERNDIVLENQAFSWNPTIAGTKCEDTYLITANGQDVLTSMNGWPMAKVNVNGDCLERPDILVR